MAGNAYPQTFLRPAHLDLVDQRDFRRRDVPRWRRRPAHRSAHPPDGSRVPTPASGHDNASRPHQKHTVDEAVALLDSVKSAYAGYELDARKLLAYPALIDPHDPISATWYEAFARACAWSQNNPACVHPITRVGSSPQPWTRRRPGKQPRRTPTPSPWTTWNGSTQPTSPSPPRAGSRVGSRNSGRRTRSRPGDHPGSHTRHRRSAINHDQQTAANDHHRVWPAGIGIPRAGQSSSRNHIGAGLNHLEAAAAAPAPTPPTGLATDHRSAYGHRHLQCPEDRSDATRSGCPSDIAAPPPRALGGEEPGLGVLHRPGRNAVGGWEKPYAGTAMEGTI